MLPLRKLIKYIFHINNHQINGLNIGYSKEQKNVYDCEVLGNQLGPHKKDILCIIVKKKSVIVNVNYMQVRVEFERNGSNLTTNNRMLMVNIDVPLN